MKNVYLCMMFMVFCIALLGRKSRLKTISKLYTGFIFIILLGISGFRSTNSIGDTWTYCYSYILMGRNPVITSDTKDIGFNLLIIGLNKITKNPQILLVVTALITNLLIVIVLYRYSDAFEMTMFLYFSTVAFYVTMNGIRQYLASAILFFGIKYIIYRDWKKYFLLIAIAYTIHASALIFIPIYFLSKKKTWGKEFWSILLIAFIGIIAFRPMFSVIVDFIESTQYGNYAKDMSTGKSVNAIRVAITAIPLILSYFIRERLSEIWPESNVFIFMSLFNFIFMLFAMQYLYFYRLCIYFELYNLVLIPRIISCFSLKRAISLYVYTFVFYSLFCVYQISIWNDSYSNILFN